MASRHQGVDLPSQTDSLQDSLEESDEADQAADGGDGLRGGGELKVLLPASCFLLSVLMARPLVLAFSSSLVFIRVLNWRRTSRNLWGSHRDSRFCLDFWVFMESEHTKHTR